MANTGVADSKSSMAVLFNPGTLAFVENSKIALSGNLYFNYDVQFLPFVQFEGDSANTTVTGFNSIPNSAVSIYKWGENSLAFSVLVPEFQEISTLQKIQMRNYDGVIQFNGKTQDLWLGLTWARKWHDKYGVGVSVFGTRYTTETAIATSANVLVNNTLPVTAYVMENEKFSALSVESVMGVYFRPTSDLSLGLQFAPPGIRLSGSGSYYLQERSFVSGTMMTNIVDHAKLDYFYRRPANAALGVEYRIHETIAVFFDAGLQFPLSYQAKPGLKNPEYIELRYAPRISLGTDVRVYKEFSLMAGFAFIPSAAPPPEPKYEGNSRDTTYLATAGLIYSDAHVRTGVGGFALYADGVRQIDSIPGNVGSVRGLGIGALLSSSYEF